MVKRTLVTGFAGFTGRYVSELLLQAGHEVHGIVRDASCSAGVESSFIHAADVADATAIRQIVSDVRPDYVVHLAAIAFVAHADVDEMYRVNVLGTRHLLEALAYLPTPPCSVLLASSANVYGNSREGSIDEVAPFNPANDYGVTKVAAEHIASLYETRLPLIVARPFNYTGRGQSVDFIVPKIVQHVRSGAAEIELGNIDVARDFSDVRTVADAYLRLLENQDAVGHRFNICSGQAISLRQILAMVERISGRRLATRVNPAFVRANEVRSLHGSQSKVETTIGPLRGIPFEQTLRWMLDE